jgi:DNA-binding NarL/FixJ family response regulator
MGEPKAASRATEKTRILLVDDHPILRQGLVRLIEREPDLTVCGEAESAEQAMEAIRKVRPALAIVDLSLEGKPGLELIKDLRAHHPDILVLVLSMHDEALWAERVIRAGACGYVMKQEKPRMLLAKIRQALRGETCLSEQIAQTLLRRLTSGRGTEGIPPEDGLGDRELEVLQLIGQGRSTRDVAAVLHISIKTVEAHREHIKRKLNLGSGGELLRYAVLRFLGSGHVGP